MRVVTFRLLASLVGAVAAAGLTACAGTASSGGGGSAASVPSGPPQVQITISAGGCGTGWHAPRTGLQTFELHNTSSGAAEVYLIDPLAGNVDPDQASAPVFGEVEGIGPRVTASMQVNVGSGAYAFECELEHTGAVIGPIIHVPGNVAGTPGILSVTFNDLVGSPTNPFAPARAYRDYVSSGLDTLAGQADALAAAIRAGDLSAARHDWLTAHLTYERLGAAYGTFGNFDSEIDGRPDGFAGGVSDSHFTGFYRVEYGLWHGQSAAELTGPATVLDQDVRGLRAAFPHQQLVMSDLGLRTHEILENALQFQLTGHNDYGSGTTLATTDANIAGTFELLKVLNPLLGPRYQDLPQTNSALNQLQHLVETAKRPYGSWTPVGDLGTTQREQIDAAAGQALEDLAPIAAIFEVQRQI